MTHVADSPGCRSWWEADATASGVKEPDHPNCSSQQQGVWQWPVSHKPVPWTCDFDHVKLQVVLLSSAENPVQYTRLPSGAEAITEKNSQPPVSAFPTPPTSGFKTLSLPPLVLPLVIVTAWICSNQRNPESLALLYVTPLIQLFVLGSFFALLPGEEF